MNIHLFQTASGGSFEAALSADTLQTALVDCQQMLDNIRATLNDVKMQRKMDKETQRQRDRGSGLIRPRSRTAPLNKSQSSENIEVVSQARPISEMIYETINLTLLMLSHPARTSTLRFDGSHVIEPYPKDCSKYQGWLCDAFTHLLLLLIDAATYTGRRPAEKPRIDMLAALPRRIATPRGAFAAFELGNFFSIAFIRPRGGYTTWTIWFLQTAFVSTLLIIARRPLLWSRTSCWSGSRLLPC